MAVVPSDDNIDFVNRLSKHVGADTWRAQAREDSETARWAHLIDKLVPSGKVVRITAMLFQGTERRVAADWLYTLVLAAYTYGLCDAFSKLADEDITLWEGQPLDFPDWDSEPPKIDIGNACIGCVVGTTEPQHHKAGCEFHKTGELPEFREQKNAEED